MPILILKNYIKIKSLKWIISCQKYTLTKILSLKLGNNNKCTGNFLITNSNYTILKHFYIHFSFGTLNLHKNWTRIIILFYSSKLYEVIRKCNYEHQPVEG